MLLAGGTGGAKLARGLLDVLEPRRLHVIANTGDDIDIYGARVSPDADLITFWLADLIDERGWGLEGDSFNVMDALRALGREIWFNLGDRDLAWCIERMRLQRQEGLAPTAAHARLAASLGLRAQVLPMTDGSLQTFINGEHLQEFLIRRQGRSPIESVVFRARDSGENRPPEPSPEVLSALRDARLVIIGPSNPVISIGPILAVCGTQIAASAAPVVMVSPIVGGRVVKGPTDAFMARERLPVSARGIAEYYERLHPGLLDGVLCDEAAGDGAIAWHRCGTLMDSAPARAAVAAEVLAFGEQLAAKESRR